MADKHLEFQLEGDDLIVTMRHRVSLAWFFDIARQIFRAVGYVIIKEPPPSLSVDKNHEDNSGQN